MGKRPNWRRMELIVRREDLKKDLILTNNKLIRKVKIPKIINLICFPY